MRRARIRLQIAKAVCAIFPMGKLSFANVRRYVTRDILTNYNIRRDTPICDTDWLIAIQVAREERVARQRDGLYPGQSPTDERISKFMDLLDSGSG